MMETAKVGRRGQLVLPRLIRRHLGLREGDRILFIPDGNRVILQALPQTLLDLRGSVPVPGPQDFEAVRRRVRVRRGRKAAQGER
jgi:AbrB family looped-hinge helix DNA binding protein